MSLPNTNLSRRSLLLLARSGSNNKGMESVVDFVPSDIGGNSSRRSLGSRFQQPGRSNSRKSIAASSDRTTTEDIESGGRSNSHSSKTRRRRVDFNTTTQQNTNDDGDDGSLCFVKDYEIDDSERAGHCKSSVASSTLRSLARQSGRLFAILIVLAGCLATALFLSFGIMSANASANEHFDRRASEFVNALAVSWHEYEVASKWIHETCHSRDITRDKFHQVYEYIKSGGLEFQAVEFIMNVTEGERGELEQEAKDFFSKEYPDIDYRGIIGLESVDYDSTTSTTPDRAIRVTERSQQPYYFPVHYIEPIRGNEEAIEFDMFSCESRRQTIINALSTWQPSLTPRLRTLPTQDEDDIDDGDDDELSNENFYSVALMHPGVPLESVPDLQPKDIALVTIPIPALLKSVARHQVESLIVYMYDVTNSHDATTIGTAPEPAFLGGARITVDLGDAKATSGHSEHYLYYQEALGNRTNRHDFKPKIKFLPEIELQKLRSIYSGTSNYNQVFEEDILVASNRWKIIIVSLDKPDIRLIIFAGILMLLACFSLSLWLLSNMSRVAKITKLKSEAQAEKAAMILENAKKAATMERDLNDFIAHEVRNPLAAALSACSFIKTAVFEKNEKQQQQQHPLQFDLHNENNSDNLIINVPTNNDDANNNNYVNNGPDGDNSSIGDNTYATINTASHALIREDVTIIEASLNFINDLLRNMLDMHRAAANQMTIHMAPTDLLQEVFQPIDSMLYKRDENFQVIIDCPTNLIVMTDKLRLQQIMLNLGRNAAKFVKKGYVKFSADVVDDKVHIIVEDSGVGIPKNKRKKIFDKFQESLGTLNQGSGIGLHLCKVLCRLMDADIWLDEDFVSGIDGCPGSRFIINLKVKPFTTRRNDLSYRTLIIDKEDFTYDKNDDNSISNHARKIGNANNNSNSKKEKQKKKKNYDNKIVSSTTLPNATASLTYSSTNSTENESTTTTTYSSVVHTTAIAPSTSDVPIDTATTTGSTFATAAASFTPGFPAAPLFGNAMNVVPANTAPTSGPTIYTRAGSERDVKKEGRVKEEQHKQYLRHLQKLPKELSVLFVDDDLVLRKLFSRSIKKVITLAPAVAEELKRMSSPSDGKSNSDDVCFNWKILEASDGESAVQMIENGQTFDIIFLDQYMTSIEKRLLGTETVPILRSKGCKSIICGLSANDVKKPFIDAGADSFLMKPFPFNKVALSKTLLELLKISSEKHN